MEVPILKPLPHLPATQPRKIIDAHTHAWPPKLYAAIVRWFDAHSWRIVDRVDGDGAAQKLLSYGLTHWVAMAYAHKPGMAAALNAWLAQYATRYPQAITLATVHPEDENIEAILTQAIDQQGLQGVKLHCHVMGIAPEDPRCFPIYEFVCQRDLPIVIHAGRAPDSEGYPRSCHEISGLAHVRPMLQRFPRMRCCLPHLAIDEWEAATELLTEYPQLMFDTAMALSRYFPLEIVQEKLIQHYARIMYGTDFPILPYAYDREWRCILDLQLGPLCEEAIFYENAARFFKLQPPFV